jgi:hypothetical protein
VCTDKQEGAQDQNRDDGKPWQLTSMTQRTHTSCFTLFASKNPGNYAR